MTIEEFLILLVIAGIVGSFSMTIAGVSRGGCITAIILGFIGALIGSYLSRAVGLPDLFTLNVGGKPFPIIWACIGGTLFAAAVALLTGRRR